MRESASLGALHLLHRIAGGVRARGGGGGYVRCWRGGEPPGNSPPFGRRGGKEQTKGGGGPAAALPSSAAPAPQRGRLGVEASAALLPPFGRLGLPGSGLRTPVAVLGPGRAWVCLASHAGKRAGKRRDGANLAGLV